MPNRLFGLIVRRLNPRRGQLLDPWQQFVAPNPEGFVNVSGQKANVANQRGPAWKSACKRDPRREEKIGIENGPTAVISVG
jgi:uridine kinase